MEREHSPFDSDPNLDLPPVSPLLDNEINRKLAQSEIEGGAQLADLAVGRMLVVQTKHHQYRIERREDGFYISGHPELCPEPTKTRISGSTWGGRMLKTGFVGRGMHLEYLIGQEECKTSEIQEIHEEVAPPASERKEAKDLNAGAKIGVSLNTLKEGEMVEATTRGHTYVFEKRADGLYASGNPKLLGTRPTRVTVISNQIPDTIYKGSIMRVIVEGGGMFNTTMVLDWNYRNHQTLKDLEGTNPIEQ